MDRAARWDSQNKGSMGNQDRLSGSHLGSGQGRTRASQLLVVSLEGIVAVKINCCGLMILIFLAPLANNAVWSLGPLVSNKTAAKKESLEIPYEKVLFFKRQSKMLLFFKRQSKMQSKAKYQTS
jgi:hypothetical protein